MMFVRTHTCFENQDATKITSALADSRINVSWTMVSFLVRTLCLCLVLMSIFSVSPFSPSFVTMLSSKPIGVDRMNRWPRNSAQRLKNYYYKALAFSRHSIDLVFDEETMKPERLTEAPENASIDPSTMRVSKWYQEPTREDDDSHFSSSSCVSDVFTGTSRTSYMEREPVEKDEERLAMKRGDMPPPLPQQVANPRIRDDQALHEFYSNSDKMHRATTDDAFTQAWFDYSQSVFPQSVRKTSTNVELFNVPTYQCSILYNNMGSFNRKSKFRRPENLNKPITKFEKFNVADLSLLRKFWRKQLRACDSDSRG